MALHVPRAPGFSSMMKDGAKFFSGLEEAVIRNIGKKCISKPIILTIKVTIQDSNLEPRPNFD